MPCQNNPEVDLSALITFLKSSGAFINSTDTHNYIIHRIKLDKQTDETAIIDIPSLCVQVKSVINYY